LDDHGEPKQVAELQYETEEERAQGAAARERQAFRKRLRESEPGHTS
jgi:hypothetical protein